VACIEGEGNYIRTKVDPMIREVQWWFWKQKVEEILCTGVRNNVEIVLLCWVFGLF
jgi:hypothetical protein